MLDLVIIGTGPAGLSASIYARRAGLDALTIEKQPLSGGQILNTYEVDNYPGIPGVDGFTLATKMRSHADDLGCRIEQGEVLKIEKLTKGFRVETGDGSIETCAIIAAMGAEHSKLGIPGEEALTGMGVSYCATCDGAFFRNRIVTVVGGGDVAVEDAIYLARTSSHVHVIHRRNELRAAKSLQEKLLSLPNVTMHWNTVTEEIKGSDHVEELVIKNVKSGETESLKTDGVFIAVGIRPVNGLLEGLVPLDEKGYAIAGDGCETGTPGIFAAGDLRTKKLRQIVTAVSDGANAVNSVENYLLNLR
ncbi:MAG: thioredoxin-disulfide reductase [Lachnospiraceae bacterium]|nr:thioredoxin-disulfide reductase [Lachnospiraceae bacterium]